MIKRQVAASLFFFLCAVMPGALLSQQLPQPTLRTTKLTAGIHVITAEVAATSQARTIGLMMRERLAPNHGMVFVFEDKSQHCFWMRNTLIPLDMIFVRADGTIANIEANTVPYSEEPMRSAGRVAAVLEIAGGRSAELGIKPGDAVNWSPAN